MNLRDRILLRTPPALQSLLTTTGSGLRYRNRFGREFFRAMAELERNEGLERSQLLAVQSDLLRQTLADARANVPFYASEGLSSEDLNAWPIVGKSDIRHEPDSFVSRRFRKRNLLRAGTSGTSGTPLTVFSSRAAYQWEMAFRWRHRAWAGVRFGARGAYLSGHLVVPQTRRDPPFWVHDRAERRLLFSSYHLSERNLPAYVRALADFAPEFVHGYPSSLYLVAQAALRSGRRPRPMAVFAASETLLAHQRSVIEDAFGCKAYVWYGQTELTLNIVECERGSLHLREDYGVMETSVDGDVLGTGLRNPAMPFIRYRTGDGIEPQDGDCACGRPFARVGSIEGRVEDYIVTLAGARVGRLDHLFKGAPGVVEAQLVQHVPGAVRVRIVRGVGYGEETERAIRQEAAVRLGRETKIDFEYMTVIPRGPGGKFRFVVSTIPSRVAMIGPVQGPRRDSGDAPDMGDNCEAGNR